MFQNSYNNYNTSVSGDLSLEIIRELESSGISQEVIDLNVQIVDDVEIDPVTKEGISTPIADALNFDYTRFTNEAKPNLTAALFIQETREVWQAKIFGENSKGFASAYGDQDGTPKGIEKRTGRYMAPKGIGDRPYLPSIPTAIARKAAAKVSPLLESSLLEWLANGGLFWEWFKNHKEISLIVTEGAKKALATISQGHIALSLFGVNCGANEIGVKPELLPYVEGRRVIIAFDEDQKDKTKKKVFYATKKLARAISYHAKGKPFIASWDSYLGKGIDDLISQYPEVFHTAINTALNFEKWKQYEHTDLSSYVSITVSDRYLSKNLIIPKGVKVIAIKSPKGTGKTAWLIHQIEQAMRNHQRIIVMIHREQLAKELSNRFGVPYRTEIKECAEGSINGYVLCIDSLHSNANPPFNPDEWLDSCVICDEWSQTLWHGLNSGTCEYNRPAILETLRVLLALLDSR
jgi:hypothetical protein